MAVDATATSFVLRLVDRFWPPQGSVLPDEVLLDARAYLDRRAGEVNHFLLLARLAIVGVLLGFFAVDALTATTWSPAGLALVLGWAVLHGVTAGLYRGTAHANRLYAAYDIALVLLLRHAFFFEALVDPNATMVGLFSLLLIAYVTYGDPRLLAGAAAAMIAATSGSIAWDAWTASPTDAHLHPLRIFLVLAYLCVVAGTAGFLAYRLREGVLGYSSEVYKRTQASMRTAIERVQRERLEELNRLKRDFIAVLSHELRTPLTPLRTSLEIVQHELDGEGSREMVGIALSAAGRLQRLVQDYTRLAEVLTLEENALDLWNVRVDDLLAAVLDGNRSRVVVVEGGERLVVTTNPRLLGGALLALVRRAELVTRPEQPITIHCEQHGGEVVLTIHDPDSFVDESTLSLDDPFARSSERTFFAANTGIELILAQHSLSRIGGRVRVESREKRGTTVTCVVPAARGATRCLTGREVREELRLHA